jgi:hypothetical protein
MVLKMNPRVSIIIVNWNGEKFLPDLISSLKGQSFRNFEIIIVENASSEEKTF